MRALTPTNAPTRVRQASVQRADQPPSVATQRPNWGGPSRDRQRRLDSYMNWQEDARHFARTVGLARFQASLTRSLVSRARILVEERAPSGEWIETNEPALTSACFDSYRSSLLSQTPSDLIGLHAWHYKVAGECYQVVVSGDEWGIFSAAAMEWDKPTADHVTVKFVPNGRVQNSTAFIVAKTQVQRFWMPDEEWQAFATSPMVASIDDLKRLWSLNRLVKRTADSRLVMNGVYWTPGEAHRQVDAQGVSQLDRDFAAWAKRTFDDYDEGPAQAAPFTQHWDKEWGSPEFVDLGRNLDPHGVEHRAEARRDAATGLDMPTSLAEGGGTAEGNHWSDWLVDDRYFDAEIAPTLDRICHTDLTRTYLPIVLRLNGLPSGRFRVGYDATELKVKKDRSEHSLKLHLAGLLKGDRALEAADWDPDTDRMDEDELQVLMDVLSHGRGSAAGLPTPLVPGTTPGGNENLTSVGPGNVVQQPPTSDASTAPGADRLAASAGDDEPVRAIPKGSLAAANRVLKRLAQTRRDYGRQLHAAAAQAFAEAIRSAAQKVKTRATSRKAATADVRAACADACDRLDTPLGPYLAAVGITEDEMLRNRFDALVQTARSTLEAMLRRQRAEIEAAGIDADVVLGAEDAARIDAAAQYLADRLRGQAVQRLVEGPHAPAPVGEISGDVPASFVANALDLASGHLELGVTNGTVTRASGETIERRVASAILGPEAEADIAYTWNWGFYTDPDRPFDPHVNLDGFTTTDRFDDPALANEESFPDDAMYQPQDHDGCSCAWLPEVREGAPTT